MRRTYTLLAICVLLSGLVSGYSIFSSSALAQDTAFNSKIVSTDHIWSYLETEQTHGSGLHSIIHCQDGGFLATGTTSSLRQSSALLVRLDETGNVLWRIILDEYLIESSREIVECQSGGFAFIGYMSENNDDALLIRLDEFGQVTWTTTFGRITELDQGYALVECQSGGFAFAGHVLNANFTNADYWLVRTDSQGNALWEQFYGGARDDKCHSLCQTEDGGFVLAGSTKSQGNGNEDAWIIRTDSDGNMLWNTTYGGLRTEIAYDIIDTANGDYVFVGESETNGNLVSDGFAASIHNNGALLWNTTFNGVSRSRAYALTECSDGGFGVTGQTVDWVDNSNRVNLWLVRLSVSGQFLWSKTYGGMGSDEGRSILQTNNGDFVIAGRSRSFYDTDPVAWILRVPDAKPIPIDTRIYGPPNIIFIGLGTGLSVLILFGSYSLYYRSRKELSNPLIKPSSQAIRKSFLAPRFIADLTFLLTGIMRCPSCNNVSMKIRTKCITCGKPLHRCLFCDLGIASDEHIVFCPSCHALAHRSHMIEWLRKRPFCPRCGVPLNYEIKTISET